MIHILCSAALLLGAGKASAETTPITRSQFETRTYQIADLVVPVKNYTLPVVKLWRQQWPDKDDKTRSPEDLLSMLIQTTIGLDSWSSIGGKGTIQYYPLGLALVVNQKPEVHEQIFNLLQSMRKMMREVSLECKLVKEDKHGRLRETPLPKITFLVEQDVQIDCEPKKGTSVNLGIRTKANDDGTVQIDLVCEEASVVNGSHGGDFFNRLQFAVMQTVRNVKPGQSTRVPLDPEYPAAEQRHWLVLTLLDVPQEEETDFLDNWPRVPR